MILGDWLWIAIYWGCISIELGRLDVDCDPFVLHLAWAWLIGLYGWLAGWPVGMTGRLASRLVGW